MSRALPWAAAATLLVAAYLYPPLAIVVVWPLLAFLPGAALLAWAGARSAGYLGLPGRLSLSILLSVALSTHLVWWIGLVAGYSRETVFAAAALLAALSVSRVRVLPDPAAVRRRLAAILRAARRHAGGFTVAALAGGGVGFVLSTSLWRVDAEGVSSGGSNWSDLGIHLSIAQSVNFGNFPPQVPFFAGVPLVYHWFADFNVAIASLAAELFAADVMVVQSAILAAALAMVVYELGLRLLGTRRAAVMAAALAVFAGGLGWIRLVSDVAAGEGAPIELVSLHSYDNQWLTEWPYFRIPSVMATGLLVHRATTAGLPMLVGAILLLTVALPDRRRLAAGFRDRPGLLLLAGLLGSLLAPFHFFYFPAVLLLAALYVLWAGRLLDSSAIRNALVFLAPFALAVPFALAAFTQASGAGRLRTVWGWESAPLADGREAVLFFYVTNLGIPFLLALAALLVRGLPHRLFLASWVIVLFAIPNLVEATAISFDMNKYFQAMWIGVALLAGWLIARWPSVLVTAVFALSVPSPLLAAAWTATSDLQVLSRDELAAAGWAATQTPPASVFVTDGWLNALTDPAGRLRLLTFTPYIANLGYEPDTRARQVWEIYCAGDPAISAALMRQHHARYVVDLGRPGGCTDPTRFEASPLFSLAYANDTVRIWELADATGRSRDDGIGLLSFAG